MNKATNIFFLGVVLLGSAALRVLENIIHRTIPLWILFAFGGLLCLYGVILYHETASKEDDE